MTYSDPDQYDSDTLLQVSGLKDILRYERGEIDQNPRNHYYYGTNGLIWPNQPTLLTCMGEIERDAEYTPGIRCNSLADALAVQASISQIKLGTILFDTTSGSGTQTSGERLHTYQPVNEMLVRRRYGDLSLGDVMPWQNGEQMYRQQPPLISGDRLLAYQAAYPSTVVSSFFGTPYNTPSNQVIPWVRIGNELYWEVHEGQRTGKVYIDTYLGAWYPGDKEQGADYKGYIKEPVYFLYEQYTPNQPPYVLRKTINLFCGLQPSDLDLLDGDASNYARDKRIKTYETAGVHFEIIFYRFATGDATWDDIDSIYGYVEDVR